MTQTTPIAFVDTETTDIGPRRLAWELAVIRRELDGTRRELQTYIEVDLADANPYALRVGRFYDRHPLGRWLAGGASDDVRPPAPGSARSRGEYEYGPDGRIISWRGGYIAQAQAAALWCRWTHGAHIVGAVPNFDTEVMGAAARAAGLLAMHHYHLIDIENLVVGYLADQVQRIEAIHNATGEQLPDATVEEMRRVIAPPWGSDDLYAAAGISPIPEDEKHTALGDARAVERAWDVVMGTHQPTKKDLK
jgi:hypothetical protein